MIRLEYLYSNFQMNLSCFGLSTCILRRWILLSAPVAGVPLNHSINSRNTDIPAKSFRGQKVLSAQNNKSISAKSFPTPDYQYSQNIYVPAKSRINSFPCPSEASNDLRQIQDNFLVNDYSEKHKAIQVDCERTRFCSPALDVPTKHGSASVAHFLRKKKKV